MEKFLLLFFLVLTQFTIAQVTTKTSTKDFNDTTGKSAVSQNKKDCITMDFHYLILENNLSSPKVRHIEIFLDEKAFSEENLTKLFRHISDKNPAPENLTVHVFTNWKQLPLPSDCPLIVISEQPKRLDENDYHKAVFYRRDRSGGTEYFRYNPVLKTEDFKEVFLKGK